MKKTQIPADFAPSEALRRWAFDKWGHPSLVDAALADFRAHHEARGSRFVDWDKALRNWVTWASPSGRFHSAREWERLLEAAKRLERDAEMQVARTLLGERTALAADRVHSARDEPSRAQWERNRQAAGRLAERARFLRAEADRQARERAEERDR